MIRKLRKLSALVEVVKALVIDHNQFHYTFGYGQPVSSKEFIWILLDLFKVILS